MLCFEFKFLNTSLRPPTKPILWRKVLLQNQTVPPKTLFQIQNFEHNCSCNICEEKSCCQTKLCQQKSCFKFKMFEYKSFCETKFLKNSLAAKPNCANKSLAHVSNSKCFNKSLVSNSKCLSASLPVKPNFWRKVLLWNQTLPRKA